VIRASLLCVAVLLTLGAVPAEAAFPGKPGPIAYPKTSVQELGGGEIQESGGLYARGAGRRQVPRRLTAIPTDREPSYSANGRRIVFLSVTERPGFMFNSIFEANREGAGRAEVKGGGSDPSFFPNGNRILFTDEDENGYSHIYSVRTINVGFHQLTFGRHNDTEPVISPNGRRIVFVSDRDRDGRGDGTDIFTMRVNGTRIRPLIDWPGREREPDYAPYGNRIVFSSNRGRGRSNIFVARANGRGVRRLTRCGSFPRCPAYSHPAFSPAGRRIAMLRSTTRSSAIDVIRSDRRRPLLNTIDSGSIEEEGFGTTVGAPTWGPRPRR
jgi:Tol biopolymer transport system component